MNDNIRKVYILNDDTWQCDVCYEDEAESYYPFDKPEHRLSILTTDSTDKRYTGCNTCGHNQPKEGNIMNTPNTIACDGCGKDFVPAPRNIETVERGGGGDVAAIPVLALCDECKSPKTRNNAVIRIPNEREAYQDDLGQTVCTNCRGDWYACDCAPRYVFANGTFVPMERVTKVEGDRIWIYKEKGNTDYFDFDPTTGTVDRYRGTEWRS